MPARKGSKTQEVVFTLKISFPRSPKEAKKRKALFEKTASWANEQRNVFKVKRVRSSRNAVSFEGDHFAFGVGFRKPIEVKVGIMDPNLRLEAANELGNQILTYLNAILGKQASVSEIEADLNVTSEKKGVLPKRIISESRIAKLSEITKKNLVVNGVGLAYEVDDVPVLVFIYGFEDLSMRFMHVYHDLKNTLPLDFVKSEYEILKKSEKIIETLDKSDI